MSNCGVKKSTNLISGNGGRRLFQSGEGEGVKGEKVGFVVLYALTLVLARRASVEDAADAEFVLSLNSKEAPIWTTTLESQGGLIDKTTGSHIYNVECFVGTSF